ncbi:Predicted arabinose efflux permease, MFS family [Mucilaginibacter pineti]|uniref:Predicted arabinose efflux permease, MFS family n=2 Tax=Mucilaginibacter pineti TaxID=1391627 RepID=A0A1G7JVZ5_9SPHI|nr:Predicted arabinose efflux permease, MFS family [Mucilaginibacter pineti]
MGGKAPLDMKVNKVLWILLFIAVINSMGFGIIIPLILSYGKKFGVNKEILGILTASFSIAQFFATPVLGTLSDRIGRKWILAFSLLGSCASFILFGLANSLFLLFAARILDGITGGNISVAQAMVSDMSSEKDRAKNFGLLGSAFGFGYVIGPAAGGLLNKLGDRVPFFFAAAMALLGMVLTLLFLKETSSDKTRKENKKNKLFDFGALISVLKIPAIGASVFMGFLLTTAQFAMLIGFQTFCAEKLKLSPVQTGLFYAGFGVSGILMQLLVPWISKLISSKPWILLASTVLCATAMAWCGLTAGLFGFALGIGIYGLFNGLRNPMLNAIIADRMDDKQRGLVMGVNQSYASIGQTIGPLLASAAALLSLPAIFFVSAALIVWGLFYGWRLKQEAH